MLPEEMLIQGVDVDGSSLFDYRSESDPDVVFYM